MRSLKFAADLRLWAVASILTFAGATSGCNSAPPPATPEQKAAKSAHHSQMAKEYTEKNKPGKTVKRAHGG